MAFSISRGTNISHWLSQSHRRGAERKAFFTAEDVKRIADWGFDHVRMPMDEEQMWNEGGQPDQEAWGLLEQALDWFERAGLRVIVDLHILRSHSFGAHTEPALFTDPKEAQRFAGLWVQISEKLCARSTDKVAYELMNESIATDHADWNRVARCAFDAVRTREPERTIVLGSNRWNMASTFEELDVPEDPHQILTFHFYIPMLITHYRARWLPFGKYAGPVHYPGIQVRDEDMAGLDEELVAAIRRENRPYDRAAMLAELAPPLAVHERTGLPLYCGEFGCIDSCPQELRVAWYRDLLSVFKEQGIAWSNWDYKGEFGIVTRDGSRSTGMAEVMLAI